VYGIGLGSYQKAGFGINSDEAWDYITRLSKWLVVLVMSDIQIISE